VEKEQSLLNKGELKADETWHKLSDIQTGDPVISHCGSVFWNDYRKKWIMILQQLAGTSYLGEVWYAEGDTPTGPWVYARKIVTHDNYSFYNVGQHPLFDQQNGRLIYFEGTYTNSFSGNPLQTPRYNYNQIMYRLDLDDSLLYLPAPVYRFKDNKGNNLYHQSEMLDFMDAWELIEDTPFFAIPPDRKSEGMMPVFAENKKGKNRLRVNSSEDQSKDEYPLFYGLPELDENILDGNTEVFNGKRSNELWKQYSSPMLVPLYEFQQKDGTYFYSVDRIKEGMTRSEKPVCLVWENPSSVLTLDYEAKPVQLVR